MSYIINSIKYLLVENDNLKKGNISVFISIIALMASAASAYSSRRTYYFNTFDKMFPLYEKFHLTFGDFTKRDYVNEHSIIEIFNAGGKRIYDKENLIRQCSIIFSSANNGDNIIKYGLDIIKQSSIISTQRECRGRYRHDYSNNTDNLSEKINKIRKEIIDLKIKMKEKEASNDHYIDRDISQDNYSLSLLEKTLSGFGEIIKINSEEHNATLKKILSEKKFKIEFDYLESKINIRIKYGGNLSKLFLRMKFCSLKYHWRNLDLNLKRVLATFKGKPIR